MLEAGFATPADLALCRQLIRQGSKSFHLASLLLPAEHRHDARALYGFCRVADDLIDDADDPERAVALLAARLDAIYAGAPQDHAVDRAFADVVKAFQIPRAVPEALIEGFVWDSQCRRYQTISDVTAYAVRVAGTVGVMMALIMGCREPEALARAIDLGVAMQFSNIARDLEEDEAQGRSYVPVEWCKAGKRAAASRLVEAAEAAYARATHGIAALPRNCRASINVARLLYREIGLAARATRHQGRAVVALRHKLALMLKAVAQTPFLKPGLEAPCLPEGQFLIDAVEAMPRPERAPKDFSAQVGWVVEMLLTVEARKT